MSDLTERARVEAERRWPREGRPTTNAGNPLTPKGWLDEGMASGFVVGAAWAAEQGASETVTTAAELDALPVGSVVLDGMGDAWQRSDASIDWWAPSNPFYCESDALNILELGGTDNPPRVLYRPTVDGAR